MQDSSDVYIFFFFEDKMPSIESRFLSRIPKIRIKTKMQISRSNLD